MRLPDGTPVEPPLDPPDDRERFPECDALHCECKRIADEDYTLFH